MRDTQELPESKRGAAYVAPRRVGRPEGVDGVDTRRTIVAAARSCFAVNGYAATSTRMIAEAAGLTTAAVYHHFGRKQDLMIAVHWATQEVSGPLMRAAVESGDTAVDKAHALFDVIVAMTRDTPEIATFEFVARGEAKRHPELREIANDKTYDDFFKTIVEVGVNTGEIMRSDARAAQSALIALSYGLAAVANGMKPKAAAAVGEACKALLVGQLLTAPANVQAQPAAG